jgi:hypothetical protein
MDESSLCHPYPTRNRKFSLWDNRLQKGKEGEEKEKKATKRKNESISIDESRKGT